jgi:response regulator NasT
MEPIVSTPDGGSSPAPAYRGHPVAAFDTPAEPAAHAPLDVTQQLRVLAAVPEPAAHAPLWSTLAELGHDVVGTAATGADAAAYASRLAPDVVLFDVATLGLSALDAAARLAATMPSVAIVFVVGELPDDHPASVGYPEARELAHAPAAAVIAARSSRAAVDATFRLAVARARELATLRGVTSRAREALEEQKTVARARGILMRRTGCRDAEAQALLERASVSDDMAVVEVARAVLASEPGGGLGARRQ